MIIIKRALIYLTKNKVKSLLVIFIITSVALFQLIGVCMEQTVICQKQYAAKNIDSLAQIVPRNNISIIQLSENLSGLTEVSHVDDILAYGISAVSSADINVFSDDGIYIYLHGCENIQKFYDFDKGNVRLLYGEFPSETNQGIIIDSDIAQNYDLSVGDSITIKKFRLKIIGIFKVVEDDEIKKFYCDCITYNELFSAEKQSNSGLVYIDAVENLDTTINELSSILGEDYAVSSVTQYDYAAVSSAISLVSQTADSIIYLGNILGFVILLLVSILWTKGCLRKISVYLSLGETKLKIALQLMSEIIILAIISVIVAYLSGTKICPGIVSNITLNILGENEIFDFLSVGSTFSFLSFETILFYISLSFGVLLLAIIIVSIYVFSFSPKKIIRYSL